MGWRGCAGWVGARVGLSPSGRRVASRDAPASRALWARRALLNLKKGPSEEESFSVFLGIVGG